MESTRAHYCDITKKFLSFVGQWPYQNKRVKLFRVTIVTIAALFMIVPQICKFIHCNDDLQCIFGAMPSHLLAIVIIVKLYTCQWNGRKIKTLTDRLFGNWEKLETSEEYEIMRSYTASGRQLTLLYSSCCVFGCFIFVLVALVPRILDIILPLNESRPVVLPYEAYYFIDEQKYFFHIFFQSAVAAMIAITGLIAHDCMLFTYIEHVCGIFAVAGFRCEHLAYKSINVKIVNNNNVYNKRFAFCVSAHWTALEYARLLENTFSVSFTIQIAIVTLLMSITLVQITLQSNDFLEAIRYVMYVVLQLAHLFIFSWQGQKLIDHSIQMRDKIYNSCWYQMPAKSQMLLLHVMRKGLRPNFVSASRIYIFSLQSFTTVVQTSVSYFTVLTSCQ